MIATIPGVTCLHSDNDLDTTEAWEFDTVRVPRSEQDVLNKLSDSPFKPITTEQPQNAQNGRQELPQEAVPNNNTTEETTEAALPESKSLSTLVIPVLKMVS